LALVAVLVGCLFVSTVVDIITETRSCVPGKFVRIGEGLSKQVLTFSCRMFGGGDSPASNR
jgi:hypothetical protein